MEESSSIAQTDVGGEPVLVEKPDGAGSDERGRQKSSSFFGKSSSFASGLKVPDIKMPSMKMPEMKMPEMPSLFGKSKNSEGAAGKSPQGGRGGQGARPPADGSAPESPAAKVAVLGSRVMVRGLSKAAQYNGQFGIVSEIIDKDGEERLCVVLEGSGRQLSVKRAVAPPFSSSCPTTTTFGSPATMAAIKVFW